MTTERHNESPIYSYSVLLSSFLADEDIVKREEDPTPAEQRLRASEESGQASP